MAAPACSARRERSAQICEAKCVVVTITGTRPRDMIQHGVEHLIALSVGQHELLGEVGEDAEPVRAGIDHEVDGALLAVEIEPAVAIEHRRHDRKYALVGPRTVEFAMTILCSRPPLGGTPIVIQTEGFSRPRHAGEDR